MKKIESLIKNKSFKTFLRYLAVGFVNTLAWLLTMVVCAYFYNNVIFYTAVGYFVSMVVSFILNLYYTFNVSGQIIKRMILFFLINLANLGVVEGLQILLMDYFGWNKYLAITIGLMWYTLTGFFLNRRFVYCTPTELPKKTS